MVNEPVAEPPAAREDGPLDTWHGLGHRVDDVWAKAQPGPSADAVATRLSAVPTAFLADEIDIESLATDVGVTELACLEHVDQEPVRLGAAMALWLLASQDFLGPFVPPLRAEHAARMVDALALRLTPVSDPRAWIADIDRREEAVRTALLWNGLLPAGEDAHHARGVLDTLDSLAHHKLLARMEEEEKHRTQIAEKLAEAAAREAAARYSRE